MSRNSDTCAKRFGLFCFVLKHSQEKARALLSVEQQRGLPLTGLEFRNEPRRLSFHETRCPVSIVKPELKSGFRVEHGAQHWVGFDCEANSSIYFIIKHFRWK